MLPLPPPLPAALHDFVESGVSTLVGSRRPDLVPESVRAFCPTVRRDGHVLRVFVPAHSGARTLDNLRDNGRIAITLSRPSTHETVQVKGRVVELREATEAERDDVDRYLARFADNLAIVGMSKTITQRLVGWPAAAVDVELDAVFLQTPGPGCGDPLEARGDEARLR